eukprot:Gb_13807 [translate_table: standard]
MAYKHPMSEKYVAKKRFVNDIAFLIENDDPSKEINFFKLLFLNKFYFDGLTYHPYFNYSVVQYFFHMENQIHFDLVIVPNNYVASGVAEPSMMGGVDKQGGSLDRRIRSHIIFFVESLIAKIKQGKFLAEAKKKVYPLNSANDFFFARTIKNCWSIPLFPFFGATFFFPIGNLRVSNNKVDDAPPLREQLLGKSRIKLRNPPGKKKVIKLVEELINLGGIGESIKGIEMMIGITPRNRRIPYGYNYYLNEMQEI